MEKGEERRKRIGRKRNVDGRVKGREGVGRRVGRYLQNGVDDLAKQYDMSP